MTEPTGIDVRLYDVGFGDCILITFRYAAPVDGRDLRHMLIDFGTNKRGDHGPDLKEVAKMIKADIGDKLDVLALTHRHRDHMAGFVPEIGGTIIADLDPDVVLRPWTEVPDPAGPGFSAAQRQLLDAAGTGQAFARRAAEIRFTGRRSAAESDLLGLATLQFTNDDAIQQLHLLAANGKGRYLRYGDALALDALPGVSIKVLGPPDPDQWPAIRKQAKESAEYWLGLGGRSPDALAAADARKPIHLTRADGARGEAADQVVAEAVREALLGPGPVRWIVDHLDEHLSRSVLRLIHKLDSVLNNTSLILLIEAAGRRMLFPGDAQIENWGYALNGAPDKAANRDLLANLDLYKVGHHGSRNATPKESLVPLWANHAPLSVMSTAPGMYEATNKVPSDALTNKLGASPFALLRTDTLRLAPPAQDKPLIHVAATRTQPFTRIA